MKNFDAIAFDIDGTLYPNHRILLKLIPGVLAEPRLINAFRKARRILRKNKTEGLFFDTQAEIISRLLNKDQIEIKTKIENIIYKKWCEVFKKIKPFKYVRETIELIRKHGYKTGVMSDFPPHEKLINLNLDGLWDAEIGSEFTGKLKPDPKPFLRLAETLGTPPERILYVGNSVKYDIAGAKNVGMKAALIRPPLPMLQSAGNADFVFNNYRQLQKFILGDNF